MTNGDSKDIIDKSPYVIIVGAGYALCIVLDSKLSLKLLLYNRLAGISAAIQLKRQLGHENFTVSFRFRSERQDDRFYFEID